MQYRAGVIWVGIRGECGDRNRDDDLYVECIRGRSLIRGMYKGGNL